jgi:hypothetical protein
MPLNLPVQRAITRGWDLYQPYLVVVATYQYDPKNRSRNQSLCEHGSKELTGYQEEEPPPASNFGTDVGDPGPSAGLDSRGWHCNPISGCTWTGLV